VRRGTFPFPGGSKIVSPRDSPRTAAVSVRPTSEKLPIFPTLCFFAIFSVPPDGRTTHSEHRSFLVSVLSALGPCMSMMFFAFQSLREGTNRLFLDSHPPASVLKLDRDAASPNSCFRSRASVGRFHRFPLSRTTCRNARPTCILASSPPGWRLPTQATVSNLRPFCSSRLLRPPSHVLVRVHPLWPP